MSETLVQVSRTLTRTAPGKFSLEALTALGQLIIQVLAMAGRAFDLPLLQAMPSLAPVAVLSPALAVVQKNIESSMNVMSGRALHAREPYLEIVRRLDEPDGAALGTTHRLHMPCAMLWAVGSIEAELGRPSALDRANAIEGNPLFALSALQLRVIYALQRGDRVSAEHNRKQTELLRVQNCPPQMFQGTELLRFTSAYALIGDMLRVKQCVAELEVMARDFPAWRAILHYGRGLYQALRGDHAHAQAEFEQSLSMISAGEHVIWTSCASALLRALTRQHCDHEAVQRGTKLLASFEAAQLTGSYAILIPLALAESRVEQTEHALRHIQEAIDVLSADNSGSVMLGEAYGVRAHIAMQLRDSTAFEHDAAACEAQFRLGNHAALAARVERLLRRARQLGMVANAPGNFMEATSGLDELRTKVSTVLSSLQDPVRRAERALRLIAEASHCDSGFLYLLKAGVPTLAAQIGDTPASPELEAHVANLLLNASEEDDETLSDADSELEAKCLWNLHESTSFTPMLLSHPVDHGVRVVGVALMSTRTGTASISPARLLQVLSQSLTDSGDIGE